MEFLIQSIYVLLVYVLKPGWFLSCISHMFMLYINVAFLYHLYTFIYYTCLFYKTHRISTVYKKLRVTMMRFLLHKLYYYLSLVIVLTRLDIVNADRPTNTLSLNRINSI